MRYSSYDLHSHSFCSDGELSPTDVVNRAFEKGVRVLALTDHDTIAGQREAASAAQKVGMRCVSGVEWSCQWRGHTIHVLGLNFDLTHELVARAEQAQTQARLSRAEVIAEKLAQKGLTDVLDDAKRKTQSGIPGRPHFAEAMIEKGYVKDFQEAFKKYLGQGKVGDVKAGWPELDQVVEWATHTGGTAVLAHPRKYNMSLTKLRALIEDFKAAGGGALEVVVSGQKQGEVGMLSDLCRRYALQASVGSDFHSPRYPWAELGRVPPLPDSLAPVWEGWS